MTTCVELEDNQTLAADKAPQVASAARRYQPSTPGSQAESDLVEQYLPLVKTVVGRIAMSLPSHVNAEDLYSVGLVGLLNAVRQFNPQGGSSFESYARVRIKGAIYDELRRLDWVPRSVHDKARKVAVVMERLQQSLGRTASDEEVAKALSLTHDEYLELMEEIRPATFVCLDAVQGGEEGSDSSNYELVADEAQNDPVEQASRRELAKIIAERLEQLPEMQRKVLALYYFEDMRLREIAEVFGVTESRICQIHSQAIMAIKNYLQRHEVIGR
ncbi:MAG TPA: FliA/WhiG family RNA polymerase sigma factor [Verrucomicrobiae bacterium]